LATVSNDPKEVPLLRRLGTWLAVAVLVYASAFLGLVRWNCVHSVNGPDAVYAFVPVGDTCQFALRVVFYPMCIYTERALNAQWLSNQDSFGLGHSNGLDLLLVFRERKCWLPFAVLGLPLLFLTWIACADIMRRARGRNSGVGDWEA